MSGSRSLRLILDVLFLSEENRLTLVVLPFVLVDAGPGRLRLALWTVDGLLLYLCQKVAPSVQ